MKQDQLNQSNSNMVERWKQYVVAGNHCMIGKEFQSAAIQYELARQCAESLFKRWFEPSEAVSALVVTYHNIADLNRKQGNTKSVLYYLEKAHDIVLRELTSTPIGDKKHNALLCASKRTYKALVGYKKCGVYY